VLVKPRYPQGNPAQRDHLQRRSWRPGPLDQHLALDAMSIAAALSRWERAMLRGSASRSTDAVIAALASSLSHATKRQVIASTLVIQWGRSGLGCRCPGAGPEAWRGGGFYRPPQSLARAG